MGAGLSSNTPPQYFGSRNSDDDVDEDSGYVGLGRGLKNDGASTLRRFTG